MSFFQIKLGPEFMALSTEHKQQVIEAWGSYWKSHVFARWHRQSGLALFLVVLVGIICLLTSRIGLGLCLVATVPLWVVSPAILQALLMKKFFRTKSQELLADQAQSRSSGPQKWGVVPLLIMRRARPGDEAVGA
jgi:hypothetical protein